MHANIGKSPATLLIALIAALIALLCLSDPGSAQRFEETSDRLPFVEADGDTKDKVPNVESEIVVVLEDDIPARTKSGVLDAMSKQGRVVGQDEETPQIQTVRFEGLIGDKEGLKGKIEELLELPGVESAEPNGYVELHFAPNDTFFEKPRGVANQGNFSLVSLPRAWDFSRGNNAAIGIADSGILQGYQEVKGKILAQKDVLNKDQIAEDDHGHGSSVASVAAARTNNKFGMAGAGFNSKFAMCKFSTYIPDLGGPGGTKAGLLKCIDWLQKKPAVKVINLSLSTTDGYSPAIASEVKQSQQRYKKLVVASVGNDGKNLSRIYPASLPGVVGVGSVDSRTQVSDFSNRGSFVDIMAPGNGIVALVGTGERPIQGFGTSFSAPTISGCAALLASKSYSADQIQSRLLRTATDMGSNGRDDTTGHGLLNCGRAFTDR